MRSKDRTESPPTALLISPTVQYDTGARNRAGIKEAERGGTVCGALAYGVPWERVTRQLANDVRCLMVEAG